MIIDKFRLPSLVGDPGGISLETNIDQRRGGDGDQPLHPPLQLLRLQTLERESRKDLNIPIRREEGDIHLLLLLPQYHIVRYMTMVDTKEIDTAHRLYRTRKFYSLRKYLLSRLTSEQTMPRPSKDSGSDNDMETWSFDRAFNEVFRLLPPELCLRSTEEHTLARPLSGIEQLMESK